MEWEENLTQVIKNTNSSLFCLYDFEDYIEEQKYIDDEVIEKSHDTHPQTLTSFLSKKKK